MKDQEGGRSILPVSMELRKIRCMCAKKIGPYVTGLCCRSIALFISRLGHAVMEIDAADSIIDHHSVKLLL